MGLRRISTPVFAYVPDGPTDPGFGGGIGAPGDPGYDRPDWAPGLPGHDLPVPPNGGHVWGAFLRWLFRPQIGGGPSKPPGRPILPAHPDNGLPPEYIWGGGGRWEILDPGFGRPPVIGWIPVDPGFGVGGGGGGTLPVPPGAWVPVDPDWGVPPGECHCGDKPHPPIWAFIPTPPDFSKPAKPQPNKIPVH